MNYRIFFLFTLVMFSCRHAKQENKKSAIAPATFIVQPFKGIDTSDVNYIATELRKIVPSIKINAVQPIPGAAFYAPRGRYRADSIIRILSAPLKQNEVMIGLTIFDISTSKGQIQDWGVMGLVIALVKPVWHPVSGFQNKIEKSNFLK